jgi:hypothetical protein
MKLKHRPMFIKRRIWLAVVTHGLFYIPLLSPFWGVGSDSMQRITLFNS